MAKVTKEFKMSVSAKALETAVLDFSKYPDFLSEVVGAEIVEYPGETLAVRFELDVLKRFQYLLAFDVTPGKRVAWRLLESDLFKKNEGAWNFEPQADGKVNVRYEVEVAFGFLVPGWVTKKLTENNLPKMIESFEKQAATGAKK